VPFLTLPLGVRVVFEKPTFVTFYDRSEKAWFSFEPFKHACRQFVSARFVIVIQNFWKNLCLQFLLPSIMQQLF
jgi:hypothetical protein